MRLIFRTLLKRNEDYITRGLLAEASITCLRILVILCFTSSQFRAINALIITKNHSAECQQLPTAVLQEILGPAFNRRYMSLRLPVENNSSQKEPNDKRTVNFDEPFVVDDMFTDEPYDQPAWEVRNHVELDIKKSAKMRRKRDSNDVRPHEWHCKAKISWLDLGPNYFPRYLRSVECLRKDCWFGIYHCKPRSFTVKLLRRKSDKCVKSDSNFKVGVVGLPKELAELWIWEERALPFCCDCQS